MELFKPAWKSKKREKAMRAVRKITDQTLLAQIAVEAHHDARREAIYKLIAEQHQPLLEEIAKKDWYWPGRKAAFMKLTDLSMKHSFISFYIKHLRENENADLFLSIYRQENDPSIRRDILKHNGEVIDHVHSDEGSDYYSNHSDSYYDNFFWVQSPEEENNG
jgi:hypothetical protein